MQLALALRAHGTAIEDPRILARTGWTTDELSAAIDAEFGADPGTAADPESNAVVSADDSASRSRFDLVTLLIGVNNQYRGRSLAEYETQFDALLARAVAFAGGRADRVMVLAIPDWGVTPFAAQSGRDTARIAQELDAFNAAAARACVARGIAFVDIAPISRARGGDAAMLVDDGLHPSAAMYAEWTALASPVAQRLLQARIR
jgi:lysophospholipase L1-like esterase